MTVHRQIDASLVRAVAERCGCTQLDVQRVALGLRPLAADRDAITRALRSLGGNGAFARALSHAARATRMGTTDTTDNTNE